MSALTSKTSSQAFFLRTLKVIIQLRDAIRLSRTKKTGEYLTIDTRIGCNKRSFFSATFLLFLCVIVLIFYFCHFFSFCLWCSKCFYLTGSQASNNSSERGNSGSQQDTSGQEQQQSGTTDQQGATESSTTQQSQQQQQQQQPETMNQEQSDSENTQDQATAARGDQTQQQQQQSQQQQQDQGERDLPVVLIDVPNPEADNAANASSGTQQEASQPATEAMDVDTEGTGELSPLCGYAMNNFNYCGV